MDQITLSLMARMKVLQKAISVAEASLAGAPEGHLRVQTCHGSAQYYHYGDSNQSGKGIYLPKSQKRLIRDLAQKDYAKHYLIRAKSELATIERFLDKNNLFSSDRCFSEQAKDRRSQVRPFLIDNETYAEMWEKKTYEENPNHPEDRRFSTKRGELVRSKSEMIFADMFYDLGIPYKYECPLYVKDGGIYHPDFTLLKKSTREVIFHEHFGKADDPAYMQRNMIRLEAYRQIGVYVGKNLIITFETDGTPPDFRELKRCFKQIFLGDE